MNTATSHAFRHALVIAATSGFLLACTDSSPVSPRDRVGNASTADAEVRAASDGRIPDLGNCPQLQVDDSKVSFRVLGIGVQIYRWDGLSWVFVAPEANLYADAGANGLVGTHFAGPTTQPNWLTLSGSRVVGTVLERCTPNADAIAWLKLSADNSGTGVFQQTKFIQRLNTVGGLAPTTPGTVVGQEARVPYSADYVFYRPQ